MRKWIIAAGMIVLSFGSSLKAQTKAGYADMVNRYIAQYRDLAVEEQRRSGIPAAITLAQGIHETVAGSSELASNANNHFGIKCKKNWTGDTYTYTDDAPDECFRKYTNAEASYRDHSDYLMQSPRYAPLFKLSVTDYASWAMGLRAAGYATNPQYAKLLIKIIEDYHLQEYTYAGMGKPVRGADIARKDEIVSEGDAPPKETAQTDIVPVATVAAAPVVPAVETASAGDKETSSGAIRVNEGNTTYPPYGQLTRANGIKAIYVRKGDSPLEYALKYDIRYERLLEMNDLSDRPIPFDMYLYLERKNFTGSKPLRTVKPGETLLQIAQEEGMQLKFLRAMNLLEPGEEPVAGVVLELQHRATEKPKVISYVAAAPKEQVAAPVASTPVVKETPATVVSNAAVTEDTKPVEIVPAVNITATEPVQAPAKETAEPIVKEEPVVKEQPAREEPVAKQETTVANNTTPPANNNQQEPAKELDELDALKARFDRVIYSSSNTQAATTPAPTTAEVKEPAVKETAPTASTTGAKFHVVKKGDTAFNIAKRYNITMTQLMEWNNLDFETIKIGQKLKVQP